MNAIFIHPQVYTIYTHPLTHALLDTESSFEFHPFVISIYTAALKRLKAADIDQEVKERAITCMGQVVASMGDTLLPKLSECMPIFVDRLRNEITRLTAVRAVTQIAKWVCPPYRSIFSWKVVCVCLFRSPLQIDITFILVRKLKLCVRKLCVRVCTNWYSIYTWHCTEPGVTINTCSLYCVVHCRKIPFHCWPVSCVRTIVIWGWPLSTVWMPFSRDIVSTYLLNCNCNVLDDYILLWLCLGA